MSKKEKKVSNKIKVVGSDGKIKYISKKKNEKVKYVFTTEDGREIVLDPSEVEIIDYREYKNK